MKTDWSSSKLVALLPFIAVLVLYATYDSARNSFFFCNTGRCTESIPQNIWKVLRIDSVSNSVPTETKEKAKELLAKDLRDRETTALRYSGRMTWYFLAMAYIFVCLASLAASSTVVFQLFSDRRLLRVSLLLLLSLIVGLFLYRRPDLHMVLFMEIFKNTISTDVPSIITITNVLDSVGNAAAFSVLLTSCATLLPSYENTFPQGLRQLSKRMRYARAILYAGTLLLVITILLKGSLYQWSLAYTSREEGAVKVAASFASSLLAVEGGFYTLVLVAVYVPAALILQRRANYLHKLPLERAERVEVLSAHGMTFSFTESLPRVLAILGPVLAGPIGQFLSRSA